MNYVLVKRGRYLEGHSYSTAHGFKFFWTADPKQARQFDENDPTADIFAGKTGARIERSTDGVRVPDRSQT